MTRTRVGALLFLGTVAPLVTLACGASMRPIPDDVQPVPPSVLHASTLGDGGALALGLDAAPRFVELAHAEHPPACADSRHHALRVHQITTDRWLVSRGVIDVLRTERKAQLSPVLDTSGHILGLSVEDVGDNSCIEALGFRNGDLIRTVNGHEVADWSTYSLVYQSIVKDGNAIVRFDRGGRAMTVLYEVRNE